MHKLDLICLSEIYQDSSRDDGLLEVNRYNLVRADHPNNTKRGGVCIYYKESLPVKIIDLFNFEKALL